MIPPPPLHQTTTSSSSLPSNTTSIKNPISEIPATMVPTKSPMIITFFFLLFSWGAGGSLASTSHQSTPPCIVQLVPCYQFLNLTSNVPDSCCKPVREAVANQKDCLCKLYETPGLLQTYNINITQVFGLTKACGVDVAATSFCTVSAQSPSPVPVAVPGKDQNGASAGKTTWTGLFVIQMSVGSLIVTLW